MINKFTEEDKKSLVEFLNMVALKANFQMNTQDLIKYFKLLSFMQQELLPKISDNILEVVKVVESKDPKQSKASSKDK